MNLDLFDTLKDRLIGANRFDEIMTYFLDHFADDPQFIELGRRETSGDFQRMVALIGTRALKKKACLEYFVATRIDEKSFIHGGGLLGGRVLTVIYFEDIGTGLIAIDAGRDRLSLLRFTARDVPKNYAERN